MMLPLIAAAAAAALIVVGQVKLDNAKSLNAQLKDVISEAMKDKEDLAARVGELEGQLKEKEERIAQLGDAAVLRNSLDNSQKVIEHLNSEMSAINSERISLQNANLGLTAKIQGLTRELTKNIDELKTLRESAPVTATLRQKVEELTRNAAQREQQLAQVSQDLRGLQQLNKTLTGMNTDLEKKAARAARVPDSAEARRLAEQLKKKELELAAAVRETAAAREQAAALQATVASLKTAGEGGDRSKELEARAVSLQKRVTELQNSLQQKTELADSLQKNLLYLTQQLAKKDEDVRAFQTRYSSMDSKSQEEILRQQARYAELNNLYSELKAQLDRMSDSLNLKNAELEQTRLSSGKDREELASLRTRVVVLQKELNDTKDRQKRTLDDLLNTVMQEKTRSDQNPVSAAADQQRKADDLKRRIEIMLEPQERTAQ